MKPIRGTVACVRSGNGKVYTFILEVLKRYSDPMKIPDMKSYNRVTELSEVCAALYTRFKNEMADDLLEIKERMK